MEEEQGGGKMKCCSRCSRIAGSSISTLPASYINININTNTNTNTNININININIIINKVGSQGYSLSIRDCSSESLANITFQLLPLDILLPSDKTQKEISIN